MKKIIIIIQVVLFPFLAYAQQEITVYGGGGLSNLNYRTTAGHQTSGIGGKIGIGYNQFLTREWCVGTGVEVTRYRAKFHADVVNANHTATDNEGDTFDFRSTVNGYDEKQSAMYLQIPLMLQFQHKIGREKRYYYVAGGFKVGIPLNAKYTNTADALNNSGFYSEEIYEHATQKFMGFGEFTNRKTAGDLDFKTAFLLTLQAGMKFTVAGKSSLYIGAYWDYGLNSIVDKPSLPFVEYNTNEPRNFELNSVANSLYTQKGTTASFTDKVKPVAAGVKVTLAFGNKWE